MKLKEKFDSIDQSKLNADQKDFLSKIEKATKNFTSDNKEVNDKVEGALDKMIATFKEKMPEAIKTKAEKKEPKATAKKASTKPSQTSTQKRTVMSVAKEIRKDGESWADAQKRARAEMKKDKDSATKEVKTEMDKLLAFIKTRKELEGISGTDLKRDSSREAKPRGRRISKDGNVYYENRENRIDRLAPNYPKDAPMLAGGGALSPKERYNLEIKGMTGVSVSAIEKYIDENNLNDNDVLNIVVGLGRKQLKGADVSTAMVGKKGNAESKKLIRFVKDDKAMKMELGGNVGGYDLAGHLDGTFNVGQDDGALSGVSGTSYSGLVGETGAMSSGEMFEDGGDLSGFTGTSYSGLVGETGAMSSGEMFENGGGVDDDNDYTYRDFYRGQGGIKFKTVKEAEEFIKLGKPFVRKQLREGNMALVYNGKEYFIGEKVKYNDEEYRNGGSVKNERKHVNHSEDYEVRYAKNNPNSKRHGYGGMKYADGGDFQAGVYANGGKITKSEVMANMYKPSGDYYLEQSGNDMIVHLTSRDAGNSIVSLENKFDVKDNGKGYHGSSYILSRKKYAEGGSLENHGIKEGDTFVKTIAGGIQKVKDKDGNIVFINLATGERDSQPPLPFKDGGKVPEFIINKDGIRVSKMVEPKKTLSEKEWMAKHNESKEARAYKYGGKLDGYSEFIQYEFPKAKREANKYSKKYFMPYIVVVEKNNQDRIGVRTLRDFLSFPKSYQESYDVLYETKVDYAEGGEINAFSMRMVKGTNAKPDEVLTENQEVKFAGGGQVEKRQAYLDTLADKEADIWDKLGAESGGEIRQDKDMLRNYALKMEAMLKKEEVGKGSFDEADYDHFQDMNAHLMNEFLVWNNYYEPEMTVREKKWRTEKFPDSKYRHYVADPNVISISQTRGYVKIVKTGSKQYKVEQVSNSGNYNMFNDTWSLDELEKAEKFAKKIAENNRVEYVGVDTAPYDFVHGKSKNYIVHADIKFVTVKKDGKELKFKGSDVLNGANILKNGGELSKSATYYPKRSIVSVELKDGKKIKPSNGYWIKKNAKAEKGAFLKNELYDKPVKVEKKDVVKFKGMLKEIGVSSPYMEDISDEQFNINQIEFYFKNKSDREKAFNKYHGMFDKAENGAVVKKKAGNPNAGSAMILAKKIRKDGEKWTDALKRANAMIKNK